MCKTINDSDDLGNIELFDEAENEINNEIILIDCADKEAAQSIFSILELPELD